MKKKRFAIVIVIAAICAVSIYLTTRPKALGNMSNSYPEQTTTTSDISFSGEAGDRIKFSLRSDVISGDLNIVLYDSSGNEVYTFHRAKAQETFFTLDHSDTYILAAECNNFVGKYKIFVYMPSD